MNRRDYENLIEPWKVDLIVSRARRMGFKGNDLDDAVHVVVIEIATFRFDEGKSNGAKESTALTAVIDNRLKKMRRAERHRERMKEIEEQAARPEAVFIDLDLPIDVRCAVLLLSAREREVCLELMRGLSVQEIADIWNCGWHTVNRLVRNIENRFVELGLDIYVKRNGKV